ncbi:MAG: 50S ribosomal protein L11 methyltransferase [Firmicutes bacterium]|nr:50S ribosomal protein L11 methyltransferase [Bacillota bacterium]
MPWAGNSALDAIYVSLTWYPPADQVADAIDFAYSLPITGVEYDDGLPADVPFTDIPLSTGEPYVRVYLTETNAAAWGERIADWCRKKGWTLGQERVRSQDWANAWKAHYEPQWFHHGYVVVPSWFDGSPADDAHTLWLDPGMAFGTGTHATTRMCANALLNLELEGKRVMDLGAGSGILGLLAARRGAASVLMVEPDPVAVDALSYNVGLNPQESPRIAVVTGTLADIPVEPYDVLCLNLIWDIIRQEWEPLQRYLAPGAVILLSGLLPERRGDVERLVASTGHAVRELQANEGWIMAVVAR